MEMRGICIRVIYDASNAIELSVRCLPSISLCLRFLWGPLPYKSKLGNSESTGMVCFNNNFFDKDLL
jgi:hypothetical protein